MVAQQDRALEDVAQLAHVAGPGACERAPARPRRRAARRAVPARRAMRSTRRRASSTTSSPRSRSGGTTSGMRADPVVEVLAELLLLDEPAEVAVGRGEEAHVDLAVAHVAQPAEAQVLDHLQQLGLHLQVHVADLVEEQRAAVGDLEQALLGRDRAREGALLVAEQLGLQQLAREPGAVEVDERLVGARPVLVEPAREHALARARLALDQHGHGRGDHARRLRGQLADDRRSRRRRDRRPGAPARDLPGQRDLPHAAVLERALEHHQQRGQLHRLGEELLGALLDGLAPRGRWCRGR